MAITFVNDLRLSEMATGDNSGTWGNVTNTNLELIGEALGYGTEGITTNADTHTSTIADGSTDPVRALYVEYTGTLDSACTITIAPNTVSKVCFIENGTSGSQNIIIKQGSGATVTIPPGDTKAVYLDGAGSGAKVVDAFASLSVVDLKVQDDLTVTDDVVVGGDIDLEGSIDVNGTANLDATNVVGTLAVTGNATISSGSGDSLTLTKDNTEPSLRIEGDSNKDFVMTVSGELLTFTQNNGLTDIFTMDHDTKAAVFTGALGVTGVLTTTAATVFNGGFAANQESTIIAADGEADNAFVLIIKNEETTDDRSFGVKINAGSTATDTPFFIKTHDDGTELFSVRGSGQARFVDGTVSLPAISNIGDLNTGIFFPAADTLALSAGGVEQIRVTSSAGVTINNGQNSNSNFIAKAGSSANALQVDGSSGAVTINEDDVNCDFRVESLNNSNMFLVDGGNNRVSIGSGTVETRVGQQLALTSSGGTDRGGFSINSYGPASAAGPICDFNVSRNTNPGSHTVVANGDALGTLIFRGDDGDEFIDSSFIEAFVDGTPGNGNIPGAIRFGTKEDGEAMAEKMRLTSTGQMFFNHTSSIGTGIVTMDLGGTDKALGIRVRAESAGNFLLGFENSGGTIIGKIVGNASATAYETSSDYRLKENVDYDWDATTRLKQLKPARFNWIEDDTNTLIDGFLAHEVSSIVPEAISGTKDENTTLTNVVLSSDNRVIGHSVSQPSWTAGKLATTDTINGETVDAIYPSDSTWASEHVVPEYQGIDQSKLVPLLVKTIQELEARITALEA